MKIKLNSQQFISVNKKDYLTATSGPPSAIKIMANLISHYLIVPG